MPVNEADFLSGIVRMLDSAEIPYMLTGSVASTYYAEPRATNDIDIVIDPNRDQLKRFISAMPRTWVAFDEAVDDAFNRRTMFNVIRPDTGEKADFILRKDREYSRVEFSRRRKLKIGSILVSILTPEDAILCKLEWAKLGQSERQLRDAAGVVIAQWKELDWAYLNEWAAKLDVHALLQELLAQGRH